MNYNKKTVKDVDVKGKKVLMRCDFNVQRVNFSITGVANLLHRKIPGFT